MTLYELLVPKGVLSDEQRRVLSDRLVPEVVSAPGAPDDLIERGRSISWLVIHEPETWAVGDHQIASADAPPYVVRVSIPGGHLNDGMRAELVARVTRALAEVDRMPERLYQDPSAWVYINEVPDGSIGAYGQIMRTSNIIKWVVNGEEAGGKSSAFSRRADSAVDPICGMTVMLTETTITLEHEGTNYAFCCAECRDIFASYQQ